MDGNDGLTGMLTTEPNCVLVWNKLAEETALASCGMEMNMPDRNLQGNNLSKILSPVFYAPPCPRPGGGGGQHPLLISNPGKRVVAGKKSAEALGGVPPAPASTHIFA